MNETNQSTRRALPHDDQIARAEYVERHEKNGLSNTAAVQRAAKEFNVDKRSIYRAMKYTKAFRTLSAVIQSKVEQYVNNKQVPVGYIYIELADLLENKQIEIINQWEKNNFPKRGPMIRRDNKEVPVSIPEDDQKQVEPQHTGVRRSTHFQAILAECGRQMGFKIWLPKQDRGSVSKEWNPPPGSLIEDLPLSYDEAAVRTVEQIDVVWLKGCAIVRAFEIEETTSVYSGLLRMSDLLALLPNLTIKLHIVAPVDRKLKVLKEIQRPTFSLVDFGPLSKTCTYLSYESVEKISKLPHLNKTRDDVIEEYVEYADEAE